MQAERTETAGRARNAGKNAAGITCQKGDRRSHSLTLCVPSTTTEPMPLALDATTAAHIGDRAEQQDRVTILPSQRARGTALVILADGAGGYTGGAAAAQQVVATAGQLFEGFCPKPIPPRGSSPRSSTRRTR